MSKEIPIRELSYDERATWGTCPVCSSPHGEWCNGDIGIPMGRNINGGIPDKVVHMGRLQAAPLKVRLQPVA